MVGWLVVWVSGRVKQGRMAGPPTGFRQVAGGPLKLLRAGPACTAWPPRSPLAATSHPPAAYLVPLSIAFDSMEGARFTWFNVANIAGSE